MITLRIVLLAAVMTPTFALAKATHPLDPLSQEEVTAAVQVLKSAGKLSPAMRFPNLTLNEPPKAEVLAFKPGQQFRREAVSTLYDREKNQTFEGVIDLRTKKLASWRKLEGVNPPV